MILVTGGAGYIGSHTCLELISSGESLVVLDDLSNASINSLHRVSKLVDCSLYNVSFGTGEIEFSNNASIYFIEASVDDRNILELIFTNFNITSIIHFAGFKAVGESVKDPLKYYSNNVSGTLSLLLAAEKFNCKKIIFSSSATVYGFPKALPIKENSDLSTTNPYGESKLVVENILKNLSNSDNSWSIIILRYFNPVGAHDSGMIGEDPKGIPNNLMPYISQVAMGLREFVSVFGNDYNTVDGTGVRDYIHVVDLALGHIAALDYLEKCKGLLAINLGTGKGYSVLDLIYAYSNAAKIEIPYKVVDRRSGDIDACYSDPSLAYEVLGWKAKFDICRMCEDSWRWQSRNPLGYETDEK